MQSKVSGREKVKSVLSRNKCIQRWKLNKGLKKEEEKKRESGKKKREREGTKIKQTKACMLATFKNENKISQLFIS